MLHSSPPLGLGWTFTRRSPRLAALILAACTYAGCTEPAGARRAPVTLKIGIALPPPGIPSSGARGFVTSFLLSDTLVGIGWDGRPIPRIAESWEWLDGTQLKIKLKPNIKLHDGTVLDAALVSQILSRAARTSASAISFPSIVAIEPVAHDALVVRLSRPEAFLIPDLSNPNLQHPEKASVGTGPFKLLEVADNGDIYRLAAFEDYHRGRPEIDSFEVRNYKEARSSWSALMRGDINAVHELSASGVEFLQNASTVQTFSFVRPYYQALFFNMRHPLLGQAAIRQALSQAIDRQKIIDLALNGHGIIANGPIWPFHWAYSTAQRTYSFNPEAATLRLDGANLPVRQNGPGMPSRLRFKCMVVANEHRWERVALVLQKQLFDIGVDMEIDPVAVPDLQKRFKAADYDAFLLEWTSGRSLGWTYATWHSSMLGEGSFNSGYNAADRALDRVRLATDDAETRAAVGDLQRVFYDEPPAIFIAWPEVTRAVSTDFVVPDEPGRDVMGTLWQWRPSSGAPGARP